MPLGQAAANSTAIGAPTSLPDVNETLSLLLTMIPTAMQSLPGATTVAPVPSPTPTSSADAANHMRLALTVTHLFLVALGSVNLLVIFVICMRPYMRSITNVYMISLCLADFIYLANLILVAATQLNDKSWPFGSFLCTVYHGTETTGKYASVIFVVLLAGDRYFAMCKANLCSRYRNYRSATFASLFAWFIAIAAASPLYLYAEVALLRFRNVEVSHKLCIAKWPSSDSARWYISFSSILIFVLPLALIIYFYYHILNKLREALKGSKRMRRAASSRAPYHRVTRLVLWVVVFHVICWSPFWLFNLFSSIFRLRISTQFDRIVVNIIHLFPYVNCALNPLLYAVHAENFRTAFRSLFCCRKRPPATSDMEDNRIMPWSKESSHTPQRTCSTYVRPSLLTNQLNTSSERLLSVHCSHSNGVAANAANLNGSIFLPQPNCNGHSVSRNGSPNVVRFARKLTPTPEAVRRLTAFGNGPLSLSSRSECSTPLIGVLRNSKSDMGNMGISASEGHLLSESLVDVAPCAPSESDESPLSEEIIDTREPDEKRKAKLSSSVPLSSSSGSASPIGMAANSQDDIFM